MPIHVMYEAILDPHPSVVVEEFDPGPVLSDALSRYGTVIVLMNHWNVTDPDSAKE